jgi:PAS domain S-box-containing protein
VTAGELVHLLELIPTSAAVIVGDRLHVNEATERLTGFDAHELRSVEQWFNAVYPDDAALIRDQYEGRKRNGSSHSRSYALHRKDGEIRIVQFSWHVGVNYELWILHDVTSRDTAIRRLEEREAQLEEAQRIGRIGSWSWDITHDRSTLSRTFREIVRLPDDVTITSIHEFAHYIHPEDLPSVSEVITAAHARQDPFTSIEFRVVCPNGHDIWISSRTEWEYDAIGVPRQGSGTIQDITDVKEARALLDRQRTMLEAAQHVAGLGSWEWEVARDRMQWSHELFHLLGATPDTLPRTLHDLVAYVHPDDRSRVLAMIAGALADGEPFFDDHRVIRPNGVERRVHSRGRPVKDSSGRVVRIVGSEQDVTDRTNLEHSLRQAQKLEVVGRLAGGIAHDFNNLLTVIGTATDFLADRVGPGDGLSNDVEEIRQAVERASALTRRLLTFSRKQVKQVTVVDLVAVVREASRMLHRLIGEDVALELDLAADTPRVLIDETEFEQVVMNLVVNARDAMPEGGTLRISARRAAGPDGDVTGDDARAADFAIFEVSDTGTGIPEDVRRHIFEPFFTTKSPERGTGLGLATVASIIADAGGLITVESEPGSGSRFSVCLPAAEGSLLPRPASESPLQGAANGETVMLVEDVASIRILARRALAAAGYKVLEAESGTQAVDLVSSYAGTVDLLVTDVVLPTLHGRAVADEVEKHHPGVGVLYMSGYAPDELLRRRVMESGTPFLAKPFSVPQLLRAVRTTIDATPVRGTRSITPA